MKKTLIITAFALSLFSCKRRMESLSRSFQVTDRDYRIYCYSGGKLVREYSFRGILNNQEHSDGYYFHTEDGTMVEISGDIIIESK